MNSSSAQFGLSKKAATALRSQEQQNAFLLATGQLDVPLVKQLMCQEGILPATFQAAFVWLCKHGCVEGVELLLPNCSSSIGA